MKKILVTGGAGYIGSHTVVELVAAGYEAIIVDDLSNGSVQVLDRLKSITGREISFYQGSVADKGFMNRVFEENHIDAVIHFAGLKIVNESTSIPLDYYANNFSGTITLLQVMQQFSCKNFIFSSVLAGSGAFKIPANTRQKRFCGFV